MRTLILAAAILIAGGLVAAAVAGRFAEDPGKRLRRECESILRQVSRSFISAHISPSLARLQPSECASLKSSHVLRRRWLD